LHEASGNGRSHRQRYRPSRQSLFNSWALFIMAEFTALFYGKDAS
jgi:hypothetical protein